uniref:29-kDa galactose-binding lectin n=1 Tax=Lumbricus terrestris TaxID=6398 RepID=UPI0000F0A4C6|nr:Chain A, 29-kDa galactose-binding lectin [Lumbricus terrestris]2DRY_B Chain B, 29-kDa galactose-binding lectin [Lumbricus terrestris]2DRZ_A Chain A, 29-kDa galactose-binding lectin [Lumbricus terrestris]2DRZ_B Chain B, 29-kDa galactose-binding lectin [Lumbricus terrestris]2DS0_A Chain A, 29-kDa galactose-binding lectin [Lumbricus terrestris]2DS0_B Chain B, 29-kDa galactose-binding lectin [Lumbricus terrestris]
PKFFYIKSELNGKVLDIGGQNPAPGSKIITWDQKKGPTAVNQLWYTDQQGVIRSKLNDFAIDASHEQIETQPFDPNNPKRAWIVSGNTIAQLSDRDNVLGVIKSDKGASAHICAWKQHGGPNQKFIIESE